jgi:hypothetical protein
MSKFQFTVHAEGNSTKDILEILSDIKDSIERGGKAGESASEDIFFRYSIDEIKKNGK